VAALLLAAGVLATAGVLTGTALVHHSRDARAKTADTIVLPAPRGAPSSSPPIAGPLSSNPDAEFIGQMGLIAPGAGWALSGFALYRTVDDTAHWTDITPPGVVDPMAHIDAVDFLDADHAWLAVALDDQPITIERTTDGGRSWQSFRTRLCGSSIASNAAHCGSAAAIDFVDDARGWAVVSTHDTAGTLLATRDGGTTWTVAGPTPFVGMVHFGGASTGWGEGRHGVVYRTTDGGKSWREIALPANAVGTSGTSGAAAVAVGGPQFFGEDHVVMARLRFGPSLPPTLTTYASADGGVTWAAQQAPVDPTVNVVNAPEYRFSAASPSDWALLYGTHVSLTRDGGRHWSTLTPTSGVLDEVDLASPTSAWLLAPPPPCAALVDDCANPLLLHTDDGGTTWRAGSPTIGITAGRLP
jgi:photosystem II stability/assembly factor-like uncharacterized protein